MASTMFAVPDWFPEELRGVLMLTLPGQESPVIHQCQGSAPW